MSYYFYSVLFPRLIIPVFCAISAFLLIFALLIIFAVMLFPVFHVISLLYVFFCYARASCCLLYFYHFHGFYVIPSLHVRHYRAPIPRYSHVGIQNISLFRSFLSFLHKEMIRIENLNFFDFMFRGYFWIPAFAGMTEGMLGMTE